MKIFTGGQIKEADTYTIKNEPISSLELMERASETIAQAICAKIEEGDNLLFFIGKGNNGGDGLAVARMLANAGFDCSVIMLYAAEELSDDNKYNFERLPETVKVIADKEIVISDQTIIIDAILGSGMKGELKPEVKEIISAINSSGCKVISIDLPSGMKTEFGNDPEQIVKADITLTLEFPKLAMLLPEAGNNCGEIEILPIELHPEFIDKTDTQYNYITPEVISWIKKDKRSKFSHKGDYGHALLVCGSRGMIGAAILTASGASRSGCGLITMHCPEADSSAVYASAPSVMLSLERSNHFSTLSRNLEKYDVCGVGPGIGQDELTVTAFERLLRAWEKPMVIDADALNILAEHPELQKIVPHNSVLTPHPGELKRLIGGWHNEEDKIVKVVALAKNLNSTIVVKGAHSIVCFADGDIYFNSTGTPGMAKGGSGDVLTGFISGLIARGYLPHEAAILGVYAHGVAGQKAAEYYGEEGMNSSDIPDFLAEALVEI